MYIVLEVHSLSGRLRSYHNHSKLWSSPEEFVEEHNKRTKARPFPHAWGVGAPAYDNGIAIAEGMDGDVRVRFLFTRVEG